MIHAVKEAGFQTVRVPVTYTDHIDENGEIREEWLERVKEIVDYVLDEDMYCVINVHHDTGNNGKITADPAALEENQKRVRDRWTQIATYFQDYGQKLVFEGLNELLDQNNNWECQGEEYAETANQLNQTFVDTVRSCRGNNPTVISLSTRMLRELRTGFWRVSGCRRTQRRTVCLPRYTHMRIFKICPRYLII